MGDEMECMSGVGTSFLRVGGLLPALGTYRIMTMDGWDASTNVVLCNT